MPFPERVNTPFERTEPRPRYVGQRAEGSEREPAEPAHVAPCERSDGRP